MAALGDQGIRILVDATADAATAERHAKCLATGIHVATACKLGAGTSLARWQAIDSACRSHRAGFGDRATVGTGLPLLRSIRELQAGGDRSHAIAGDVGLTTDGSLAGGSGTDNRVAIWSDRYPRQPLGIQGPDAGADISAAGLLDDVLDLRALAIGQSSR